MKMGNAFKTGKSLQWAIDNKEQIDGFEDYLDQTFAYVMLDLDNGSSPTWGEALNQGKSFEPCYWMFEGSIDFAINGVYEYDTDNLLCEYVPGYHGPLNYGDTVNRENLDGDMVQCRYIASIALGEETEHQAENGGLAYDYRGFSFVRVFDTCLENEYPKQ